MFAGLVNTFVRRRRQTFAGSIVLAVIMLFCSGAIAAAADMHRDSERPAEPWPGPAGAFVAIEGESFTPVGDGWQVKEARNRRAQIAAGNNRVISGAYAGSGSAVRETIVPEPGDYRLLVRYTAWTNDERPQLPLKLTIAQKGRVVAEHTFGDAYDSDESVRDIWAAFVVGEERVKLEGGSATLTLSKVGPETGHDTQRWVDQVVLVRDPEYVLDYRDFMPQTYVRMNLADATFKLEDDKPAERAPGYFYCFVNHTRSPWYQNTHFSKIGWGYSVNTSSSNYLSAGESTPWCNVTRLLYPASDTMFKVQVTRRYHNPDASTSRFSIDFATRPGVDAIFKTVMRDGDGAGLMVRIPVMPDGNSLPKADYEFANDKLEAIAKLPEVEFGSRPQLFPLMTDVPTSVERNSPLVNVRELEVMQYLGLNGRDGPLDETDWKAGMRFNTLGASIWYRGEAGYNQPDVEKMRSRAERYARDNIANAAYPGAHVYTKMMDEAGAEPLSRMAEHAFNHQAFRAWLAKQDHSPLTDEQIADARIATDRSDPVLYYFSQRFRAYTVANFFNVADGVVSEYYPDIAEPTQNFSDGAVYGANFYLQGNDYFQYFREFGDGAMRGAQSEDWTNHGATHQLCGWNVALLRAATRVHQQPIFMYVIASHGRSPLVTKLKSMTDIAEGAEVLRYYSYAPKYASHEHGFSENYALFPAIAEVSREIGGAEHVLKDARPVKADTAIIYSIPTDIWTVGTNAAFGNERMSTWLALEHAQIPSDVVSDEDVVNNYLVDAGYKVAYLQGEQIDVRMAEPLAAFVKQGGRLVLGAGAGSRDRFNRPTDALDKALGIKRGALEHLQEYSHASLYMCRGLQPKGSVALFNDKGGPTGSTDLLAMRQTFDAQTGDVVLAKGDNEETLALRRKIGRGSVDLVGFLPAMAYLREARLEYDEKLEDEVQPLEIVAKAMVALGEAEGKPDDVRVPRRKHSAFPTGFEPHVRDFITGSTTVASRPVSVSHPMVAATLLESDKGYAVVLANWSGEPIKELVVTLPLARSKMRSSRQGQLPAQQTIDGRLSTTVTLPLESTDIIYFEKWALRASPSSGSNFKRPMASAVLPRTILE